MVSLSPDPLPLTPLPGTLLKQNIFTFLPLYRFFAYGLAVVLFQVVSLENEDALSGQDYAMLSGFGVYTLFKVLGPLCWREEGAMTYVMLGGDVLVCVIALLLTGGLNSAFLLYSLTPIMTAALLFTEVLALAAAITSAILALSHLLLYRWVDEYVWIMEEKNLPWLLVFVVTTFLTASVVHRTNLNIRRRIEVEAVEEERRRTKRELHDGMVQAIGYLNLKTQMVSSLVQAGNASKALESLDDMSKTVQEAYKDARETLDELSLEVGAAQLVPTLEEYVHAFGERHGIQVYFEAPSQPVWLSPMASLQLLRVTQEALTNVRKHAQATEVWFSVITVGRTLELLIKDNG